jgi:hypothetical protein
MSSNPETLIDALKRLASGGTRPEDRDELQQARKSGRVTIATNGSVAVGRDVHGDVSVVNMVLPPEVLKVFQPIYQPPPLPSPGTLAELGHLPLGSRLPFSPNAVFIGRQEDLLDLAQALLYPQEGLDRNVVIVGMGGLGKTQLAVEFCYRYGQFFQGVHWFQANLDIQSEVAEMGSAMNLPDWPDTLPEQVQVTLRALQGGGRRLIVLDNAEDLKVVRDWLPRLSPANLLITSLRDKWPADLGFKVKNLETLARSQSIELLRKLAPRLEGVPDESLDKLANLLGDLPLALDLAGRYLADRSVPSIEGYMAELEEAGSILEHTSLKDWVEEVEDSPTRHSTSLAETFILSWQQLTEGEIDKLARRLFRVCGYCEPNTPIPWKLLAKSVGAEDTSQEQSLDLALKRLRKLGLVKRDERGSNDQLGWPIIHNLLAEFARLKDSDEKESVLPVLATAMSELAQDTRKTELPGKMIALWGHLCSVYRFSETSGLREAEALKDFLPKLDFSRPENSIYIHIL